MSLNLLSDTDKRRKLIYGTSVFTLLLLVTLGIFAANDWLPKTDSITGKKTGWFGRELPPNASSSWNPLAPPIPNPTPQLSKEYIYAGSRLLAIEDANVSGGATPTPTPPVALEADIVDGSGGSAGDGQVLANDVTAIRNIILGNVPPPNPGSQYQRADVAAVPCGDAAFFSNDVTVVRNYVLGVLPLAAACGPTGPGNRPERDSETAENKEVPLSQTNVGAPPADLRIRVNNAIGPGSRFQFRSL